MKWPFKKERNVKLTENGSDFVIWIEEGKTATAIDITRETITGFIKILNSVKGNRTAVEVHLEQGFATEIFTFPAWSVRESLRLLVDTLLNILENKEVSRIGKNCYNA